MAAALALSFLLQVGLLLWTVASWDVTAIRLAGAADPTRPIFSSNL